MSDVATEATEVTEATTKAKVTKSKSKAKAAPKSKRGPGRPAHRGPAIVLALSVNPGQTVKQLNSNMPMILSLKKAGLVENFGTVKNVREDGTTGKGRPQSTFRLTKKGRDKARTKAFIEAAKGATA